MENDPQILDASDNKQSNTDDDVIELAESSFDQSLETSKLDDFQKYVFDKEELLTKKYKPKTFTKQKQGIDGKLIAGSDIDSGKEEFVDKDKKFVNRRRSIPAVCMY